MTPIETTVLGGGLTVATEPVDGANSVCFALAVGVGSRFESATESGASHFLEHLLFRGTPSHSSSELDAAFDRMGGAVDAMTGRESTTLIARVGSGDGHRAFSLLCEMVARPLLADVELERSVILEELAMTEDDPGDRLGEAMSAAVFGSDPLGRPIAGTAETVEALSEAGLREFHRRMYAKRAVTVVAAGAVDPDWFVELAGDSLASLDEGKRQSSEAPAPISASHLDFSHPSEQVHIQIGGRAPGRESAERFSVRAFDVILGGSVSSRLFSELRESRGLAYDTGSFISGATGVSEWGAYIATRPERAAEAAAALGEQIKQIRSHGVTLDEVSRAVSHLRGRYLLSRESMAERAGSTVSQLGAGLQPATASQVLGQLEAVTVESVNQVVAQLTDPAYLHAGSIGPGSDCSAAALEAATSGTLNA